MEPQPDDEIDDIPSPHKDLHGVANDTSVAPNLSQDAIRSISEMLKQNPTKRKDVTLNISPRKKQKRHQKMKNG